MLANITFLFALGAQQIGCYVRHIGYRLTFELFHKFIPYFSCKIIHLKIDAYSKQIVYFIRAVIICMMRVASN